MVINVTDLFRLGERDVGRCMQRMSPGRLYATFHPDAPSGLTYCPICGRVVIRNRGRWWSW